MLAEVETEVEGGRAVLLMIFSDSILRGMVCTPMQELCSIRHYSRCLCLIVN